MPTICPRLPLPVLPEVSFAQRKAIMSQVRALHRDGTITAKVLALADTFVWSLRKPGYGAIEVSYTALQRLTHSARDTIAAGLDALEEAGLIRRHRRQVITPDWHQGGSQCRQATTVYELVPPDDHESSEPTVSKTPKILTYVPAELPTETQREAQAALQAIAERRAAERAAAFAASRSKAM